MKRWRILTLLLAVLAAGGLLAAGLYVSAAGRNVVYDETILQGEEGDFAGVVVQAKSRMRNEVLWETAYHPGGEAESTVKYGVSDWEPMDYPPFLRSDCHLLNGPEFRNEGEADALVQNVAAGVPVGETRETVIRAADWYEGFPLRLELDGVLLQTELHIPVPEDFMVRVTVSRQDPERYSFTIREATGAGPTMNACSAGYEEGGTARCWFALDTGKLDTDALPGGGGVFYTDSRALTITCAWPLPAGTRVDDLWLAEDQSTLYVLHTLDGTHTLTALDIEDMAVLQEINLPIAAEAALEPTIRDGETVLLPATDGTMTVLSAGDDNLLMLRTQVSTAGDPVLVAPAHQDLRELVSADFRDGRLVLARQQYLEEDMTQDLDVLLSVYSADGSRSTMVSRCSIGREIDPERESRYEHGMTHFPLRPGWTRPVIVRFENG